MSTIDNRIVRMQFDNAQFEAGVSRSMATLDKLNEKLEFKGAEKGTSALQRAMDRVDLSKIESALDQLTSRFSTIGTAWGRVVENMVDKAMAGFKKLEQETLGQIKTGGWSRAMNLANAQFTIEGLKMDWNKMLKAINYGVQDTAYGLDSAAKAAASLAASGVAYQESVENANDSLMHTSLRAISGVAAMTNSSYDDIANVFTKVAGNGRLMGDDLQRLSSRGMNAAATLAEALNTTEAKIRDMVSEGDISFQMFAKAMDRAFGEHAKEANKTFQGALSNMKAALSRVGAIFATPVIGKTNILFLAMKDRIGEVQKALSDLTQTVEVNGKKITQVVQARFATHFAEAWEAAMEAADHVIRAIDLTWIQKIANAMDMAAQRATFLFKTITGIFERVKGETKKTSDDIGVSVDSAMTAFDIFFNGKYGNGSARIKALKQAGKDVKEVQSFINDFVRAGYKVDKMTMSVAGTSAEDLSKYLTELSKNGYKLTDTTTKLGESVLDVGEEAEAAENFLLVLSGTISNLWTALKNLGQSAKNVVTTLVNFSKAMFSMVADRTDLLSYTDGIADLTQKILSFTTHLKKISQFDSMDKWMNEKDLITAEKIIYAFRSIVDIVSNVIGVFRTLTSVGVKLITEVFKYFSSLSSTHFLSILDDINDITSGVRDWAESLKVINKLDSLGDIKKRYDGLTEALAKANSEAERGAIQKQIDYLVGSSEEVFRLDQIVSNLGNALSGVVGVFRNVGEAVGIVAKAIAKAFVKTFNAEKVTDGVVDLSFTFVNLSETLVTFAEKAAPAIEGGFSLIFTAAQAAWKIITKVSESITRFIANILSGDDATGELVDTVDTVGETAKETKGFFDVLLDIFTKFADGIKGIPDILDELFTKLSQNQGVIRLKTAISDLWKIAKDSIKNALNPFSNAIGQMDDTAEKSSGVDSVVSAIGWIADKLASFIEKIPGWITTIENFAKTVKEHIVGLIDDISNRIDRFKSDHSTLTEAVQMSEEGIEDIANERLLDKIIDRVKTFSTDIGKAIGDGLSKINWKEIAGLGLIVTAIVNLYNLNKLTVGFQAIPKSIAGVFEAFKGVAKSISGFFNEVSRMTKYAAIAGIVTTISATLVILIAGVYALASMDENKLYQGLNAITELAAIIIVIMALIAKILSAANSKKVNKNLADNKISLQFIGMIGQVALLVGAVAAVAFIMSKALKTLDQVEDLGGAARTLVALMGSVAIIVLVLMAVGRNLIKGLENKNTLLSVLGGVSILMVALGISLAIISGALRKIAESKASGVAIAGAVVVIVVIMAALARALFLIGKVTKGTNTNKVFAIALVIAVLAGAVVAIVAILTALVAEFAAMKALGQLGAVALAVGAVAAIIVAIGGAIALAGVGLSKVEEPGKLVSAILAMAAVLAVAAIAIGILSTLKTETSLTTVAITIGAMVATLAIILGVLAAVMNKQKISGKELVLYASGMALMAASVLLIAGALAVLANAIASNPDAILQAAVALGIFIAAFAVIAAIVAVANVADAFVKVGAAFLLMGAGALLVGLGLIGVGQGLMIIAPLIPALLVGLDGFFKVLEEHWPMVIAIVVIVGLITVLVAKLAAVVVPILNGIADVVKIVVQSIGNLLAGGFKTIGGLLSSGAKKLGEWASGLKLGTKVALVSIILSLCAALLETGPQVLQTIGKLIIKLFDWLTSMVPILADKLVSLLVSLINGFADAISTHANAISAAIGAVINSLLTLILAGLRDLLAAAQNIPLLGNLISDDTLQAFDDSMIELQRSTEQKRREAERKDAELRKALGKDIKTGDIEYNETTPTDSKESGEKAGGLFGLGFNIGADSEMGMSDVVAKVKNSADLNALGNEGGKDFGLGFDIGAASNMGMSDIVSMAGGGELGDIGAMKADDFMDGYSFEMASPSNINTVEDAANEGYVEPVKTQLDELEPAATDATHRAVDGMITALWEDRKDFQGMFHNQYVTMPIKMMTGKNGWDEHSPSHVFQHIAEFAVMGLMRGFDGQSEHLGSSVSSLSDQVIKSFGDPLARIGAMANGEIEYDPSIRPVLDSSNIAAGASDINSLFRNQNVSLSGLSGRLAADLGEVTANNADIVDELVALRSDMADMTDRMSNLQVVMNNGALVGAIAGDMDAALGQRTNFRRRGN